MDPTLLSRLSQTLYEEKLQYAAKRRFWAKQGAWQPSFLARLTNLLPKLR